jgi:hypothetical protein
MYMFSIGEKTAPNTHAAGSTNLEVVSTKPSQPWKNIDNIKVCTVPPSSNFSCGSSKLPQKET